MSDSAKSNFIYTALFCEENIWQLANTLIQQGVTSKDLTVVFISNNKQQVAVFNQKTVESNQAIIWDYHVVLLRKNDNDYLIYDFDSRTRLPSLANNYLESSFPVNKNIPADYQPCFRLFDSSNYLKQFNSDRSHMIGVISEELFPEYAALKPDESITPIDLQQFIDTNKALNNEEKILDLSEFKKIINISDS